MRTIAMPRAHHSTLGGPRAGLDWRPEQMMLGVAACLSAREPIMQVGPPPGLSSQGIYLFNQDPLLTGAPLPCCTAAMLHHLSV